MGIRSFLGYKAWLVDNYNDDDYENKQLRCKATLGRFILLHYIF